MCLSLRPPGSQDRAWAGSRVGQGPAFPHCTRSQHGALRKSTTLYLNLAFHLVMKDCLSVQVCSSGGAWTTHQGKRRLDARGQVLPPSQTVLTLPGAGLRPSPAHREPSGVEVEGGDRACTHQRPAASGEQLRTAANTLFPVSLLPSMSKGIKSGNRCISTRDRTRGWHGSQGEVGKSKVTPRDRPCSSEVESGAHAGREDAALAQAQASEGRGPPPQCCDRTTLLPPTRKDHELHRGAVDKWQL